jgi:CRISPR-associated protein Cmr2
MTIDYFAELGRAGGAFPNDLNDLAAVTTCYHYLVAIDHKKDRDTGGDALRAAWAKERLNVQAPAPDVALWQLLVAPGIDLAVLPPYSFSLSFNFELAQPYMSKDDNAFYIIDNPIVRDKVFRLPMVRASSWKGSLRHALWQLRHQHDGETYCDACVQRMFGETRGDDTGQAGRLFFYPTFFSRTSLEIVNPHDRVRRVGKTPILFESVPGDTPGRFTLLYVPFDRVGEDEAKTRRQATEDLRLLAQGLQSMFTLYGFGAKTSSGFGLAREAVKDGQLSVRAAGLGAGRPASPTTEAAPAEPVPRYLEAPGRLKAEYRNPDGSFRHRSEAELRAMKKADRQLYDKAKSWWEREGQAPGELKPEPPEAEPATAQAAEWPSWPFASFEDLVNAASQVAQQLSEGDRP